MFSEIFFGKYLNNHGKHMYDLCESSMTIEGKGYSILALKNGGNTKHAKHSSATELRCNFMQLLCQRQHKLPGSSATKLKKILYKIATFQPSIRLVRLLS